VKEKFECLALEGLDKCCTWVTENVLPALVGMRAVKTKAQMYSDFWDFYTKCKKHDPNFEVWVDVSFPVEVNFLLEVAKADYNRESKMPYPLLDISTIVDTIVDRVAVYEKDNAAWILQDPNGRKLRKHNPMDDCIASLHCLFKSRK
jgi:hypothetical protein